MKEAKRKRPGGIAGTLPRRRGGWPSPNYSATSPSGGPLRIPSTPLHSSSPQISRDIPLVRKQVDDVLGGSDAWKNVDKTEVTCPKCAHGSAYYMQVQTRSADEPMSIFYKCCAEECGNRWREG